MEFRKGGKGIGDRGEGNFKRVAFSSSSSFAAAAVGAFRREKEKLIVLFIAP